MDCVVIEYMHQKKFEKITFDVALFGNSDFEYFDTKRGVLSAIIQRVCDF